MRSMDINGDDGREANVEIKLPEGYDVVCLEDEAEYLDGICRVLKLALRADKDDERRSCRRLIKRAIKMLRLDA